ncbi:hypothetical protein [Nonlabens marinus]|uniref:Uncharacterized protein n=1 Tax=Nonlabens marinus S1-08 TaxID=1454201 RepID=W8VW00_9FLAO|nr:hypothetical protein [Nonlabens marinus]BAO55898.1 hypothetical protein NMS_1889 [Nonlabens marinus S1-08]
MKTILKWLLRGVLGLIALLAILFLILKIALAEDVPTGLSGPAADELAFKVLDAIEHEKFKEAELISWTFRGTNHYKWYPQQGMVEVRWDDKFVKLDLESNTNSLAFEDGTPLNENDTQDAIAYALKNFNNDSFWMVAPHKIMDPGTEREIIREDAQEKLLVRYLSGGTTPGDVYVWKLDKNYRPQNFKMWVSILPFDGVEAKWNDWEVTDAGFPISKRKSVFGINIPITDIQIK